jgi:hypothetical protein
MLAAAEVTVGIAGSVTAVVSAMVTVAVVDEAPAAAVAATATSK